MFGSVRSPTSPGVVVVGHSVCGLDGGEVGLQGEQLTGQVWHTAGKKIKIYFHLMLKNLICHGRQVKGILLKN